MKKVLVMFLALSLCVLMLGGQIFAAGPLMQQKTGFYLVTNGSSDLVTDVAADGSVKIVTPRGKIALIIQGNIKGLEPNAEYYIWVRNLTGYTGESLLSVPAMGYFKMLKVKTNIKGIASFHINIQREHLPSKTYKVQIAVNRQTGADQIGTTVIATKWPGLDVTVEGK